ncbi:hypothetical protein, partial [Mycolicibacter heraklionensis]|uniref:hypothetical protein n=1 Tax=Mycolicibacter heraklionensis TaxID=512402 RepID=UPI001A9580CB
MTTITTIAAQTTDTVSTLNRTVPTGTAVAAGATITRMGAIPTRDRTVVAVEPITAGATITTSTTNTLGGLRPIREHTPGAAIATGTTMATRSAINSLGDTIGAQETVTAGPTIAASAAQPVDAVSTRAGALTVRTADTTGTEVPTLAADPAITGIG